MGMTELEYASYKAKQLKEEIEEFEKEIKSISKEIELIGLQFNKNLELFKQYSEIIKKYQDIPKIESSIKDFIKEEFQKIENENIKNIFKQHKKEVEKLKIEIINFIQERDIDSTKEASVLFFYIINLLKDNGIQINEDEMDIDIRGIKNKVNNINSKLKPSDYKKVLQNEN